MHDRSCFSAESVTRSNFEELVQEQDDVQLGPEQKCASIVRFIRRVSDFTHCAAGGMYSDCDCRTMEDTK